MIVVVSVKDLELGSDTIVINSLSKIFSLVGSIEALIYNSSIDDNDEVIRTLGTINEKNLVSKYVYICNESDVDYSIKTYIEGINGNVILDEYYLSKNNIKYALVNSTEIANVVDMSSDTVIEDFKKRVLQLDKDEKFTKYYLQVVLDAVDEIKNEYGKKSNELTKTSASVSKTLDSLFIMIDSFKSENKKLQKIVSDMKVSIEETSEEEPMLSIPSVKYYPEVKYLKKRNILKIKELGNNSFITSFFYFLKQYMVINKKMKTRLIYIMPIGDYYRKLYENWYWADDEPLASISDSREVVFLSTPESQILMKLLESKEFDYFIVIDRTSYSVNHMLHTRDSIDTVYVSSSESLLSRSRKMASDFISVLNHIEGELLNISKIDNYPKEVFKRQNEYMGKYSSSFDTIIENYFNN